ncbi:MAG: hypothetical protein Q8P05_03265 [Candidatus Diapherotrites archaeon]|nr:hypothetical protein [Candidatus Diapherotrites archaeon]MDZ4255982.1 hypothetical protein [archaeon]
METLVKMSGVPEDILTLLIAKGYFKTKTEALRAGVLELGKEYHLLDDPKELELELVAFKMKLEDEEMKNKGMQFETEENVKKKYGFK